MPVTKEQALTASEFHEEGSCCKTVGPRGGVKVFCRIWRRNGKTKTWKTRPTWFRVPVKYGLYDCDYLDNFNASHYHAAEDCPLNAVDMKKGEIREEEQIERENTWRVVDSNGKVHYFQREESARKFWDSLLIAPLHSTARPYGCQFVPPGYEMSTSFMDLREEREKYARKED